jgi:hypothetical protein
LLCFQELLAQKIPALVAPESIAIAQIASAAPRRAAGQWDTRPPEYLETPWTL